MVLFCASDLLWATRIKGTADALGIPCRPARTVEMLDARLSDSPVRGIIVDLEAESGVEVIRAVRERDPEKRIGVVAFGPHVGVERLEEARAAGADRVMARGAFDRGLAEILRTLATAPS
jgi:hypothetical protein